MNFHEPWSTACGVTGWPCTVPASLERTTRLMRSSSKIRSEPSKRSCLKAPCGESPPVAQRLAGRLTGKAHAEAAGGQRIDVEEVRVGAGGAEETVADAVVAVPVGPDPELNGAFADGRIAQPVPIQDSVK